LTGASSFFPNANARPPLIDVPFIGAADDLAEAATASGPAIAECNREPADLDLHGDVEAAGRAMGLQIQVLNAGTSREIDAAFASFSRERPDAVFVGLDAFLNSRRAQLVNLASRHALPAIYANRDFPEIGGLMSYGTNIADGFRQIGVYTGRILKGAKPVELPVLQSNTIELVIKHQTARMLGLTVPDKLIVAADEVIE
jgi:ABC-type uncharacterized transport system substrate-binding protein